MGWSAGGGTLFEAEELGFQAAALAGEMGLPLFSIQLDGLLTRFMGEAAAKLRLIFDAMCGDQSLFIRGDEAEAAWSVIDPIEIGWKNSKIKPYEYTPGTWGPQKAMDLIELDGRRWTYSEATESPVIACAV